MPSTRTAGKRAISISISISIAVTASVANAEVGGVPRAPAPGDLPSAWVSEYDDAFFSGFGKDFDDFRTSATTAALRTGRFISAVDYSLFTDKYSMGRLDECTFTEGWVGWYDAGGSAIFGIGASATGRIGGEAVQNGVHRALYLNTPALAYDRDSIEIAPLAYMSCTRRWWMDSDSTLLHSLEVGLRPGLEVRADGLAATTSREGDVAATILFAGADGVLWFGASEQGRTPSTASPTARAVSHHERGPRLEYGLSLSGLTLSGGYGVLSKHGDGAVGWSWRQEKSHGEDVATVEFGVCIGRGGTQVQFREAPSSWHDSALGRRLSMLLDYRYVIVSHWRGVQQGTQLVTRQGLVGLDLAAFAQRPGLQVDPFVYAGAGWRAETLEVAAEKRAPPLEGAACPVVQGGIGVRIMYQGKGAEIRNTYGLSVTGDGWLPIDIRGLRFGSEDSSLLWQGMSASARFVLQGWW